MPKHKHTPGPWSVEFAACNYGMNGAGTYNVQGPKGIVCNCEESTIEETEANARLIAAAPELLVAVELVVERLKIRGDADVEDAIITALAKAKGE